MCFAARRLEKNRAALSAECMHIVWIVFSTSLGSGVDPKTINKGLLRYSNVLFLSGGHFLAQLLYHGVRD